MIRRPPRSTRTDTLFPYTTLFRSADRLAVSFPIPHSHFLLPHHTQPVVARLPSTPIGALPCEPSWLPAPSPRSEEHTSELQSLMRISYAVFCLKKKKRTTTH